MLKAALIGYGGIAQGVHVPAYKRLEQEDKARLCAAFDIEKDAFAKSVDINISSSQGADGVHFYTDLEEMLRIEQPDLVDICVPTPYHVDYAIDMLQRGYNVLCEKPMGRTAEQCDRLVKVASQSKGRLMIGQCLRFFPTYDYVKQAILDGRFGRVKTAVMRRLSPPPGWGWHNWFREEALSGGALLDLHIHDIDMARYLFGEPTAVSCVGTPMGVCSHTDFVTSRLFYPDVNVIAVADWSANAMPFLADFRFGFEKANVVLDGDLTVYPYDGEPFKPVLRDIDGYTAEIEFLVDTIINDKPNLQNPPESACKTVHLIETLDRSAKLGGAIVPFEEGKE